MKSVLLLLLGGLGLALLLMQLALLRWGLSPAVLSVDAGIVIAPDGRTLFVNVQHPGETPSERTDPAQPRRFSNWPDFRPGGRPRSATLVITRTDGGFAGPARWRRCRCA